MLRGNKTFRETGIRKCYFCPPLLPGKRDIRTAAGANEEGTNVCGRGGEKERHLIRELWRKLLLLLRPASRILAARYNPTSAIKCAVWPPAAGRRRRLLRSPFVAKVDD